MLGVGRAGEPLLGFLSTRLITTIHRFEEHSHGDEGNNRHSHFINVLTSTWSILRPNPEARTSHVTPKASKPEQEPSLNFANRFSGLNVEETPEEYLNFGTSAGQAEDYKLPGVAPVVIQNSEEDLEDDFMFAIYTFMCEVEEVRFKVQSLWEGYRRGILELMLCSIVTNTAIQLVRRAEHECRSPFPEMKLCVRASHRYH